MSRAWLDNPGPQGSTFMGVIGAPSFIMKPSLVLDCQRDVYLIDISCLLGLARSMRSCESGGRAWMREALSEMKVAWATRDRTIFRLLEGYGGCEACWRYIFQ